MLLILYNAHNGGKILEFSISKSLKHRYEMMKIINFLLNDTHLIKQLSGMYF